MCAAREIGVTWDTKLRIGGGGVVIQEKWVNVTSIA
jgi:hypothetical protein